MRNMIRSYFKTAWRNIIKHKVQSAINILSLSLGITCYLLISLWLSDEQGKDNFHEQQSKLYTTYITSTADGKKEATYASPFRGNGTEVTLLLEDAKEQIPEIEHLSFYIAAYELPWGHLETFQLGEKKVKLAGSRASKDFFKMFSFPLIEGRAETALDNLYGVAISRKMAEIFFGSPREAMGKSLRYENKYNFIVTAVFENIPKESSLQFDYVFNWDAQKRLLEWASNNIFTYVQFKKDTNIKQAEKKLSLLLDTKLEKRIGIQTKLGLQRFGDQYLFNHFVEGEPTGGRIEYIRLFKGAAIFILLLACINFMNLATARSVKRAKEVGLRKVVGSNRTSLIGQFFGESILCCALATILSAILLLILLPTFNGLTGKEMDYPFFQLSFWIEIISLVLITGIIAGMYPALYLSSLKPIQIVKGINCSGKKAILFRKTTTIFQFSLSSLLIIATVVISNQVSFIKNNNLGYDRENLLYVRIEGELSKFDKYQLFKQKASNLPGISMIDRSSEAPHEMSFETTTPIDWQGKPDNASVAFKPASVGFDFVNLMKLTITEGRNFSRNIQTDSADAFLVNEEAVRQMGYKDPLGKWVSAWNKRGHIIGVLKDFHTESLHDPIKPLILDVKEYEYFGFIIVRTKPNQLTTALANLEKVYNELNPNFPFMYQFADQEYENMYKSELTTSRLAIIFAILAIVISCLGLLGLVTFSIEQRIKEIGIRRIMGATISGIVGLLSKDFLKLVVISLFISIPLGYIWMNKWLNNFAYSIQLRWWMFFIAGMAVLIIALLTISIQVIQAASAKPVTSLREE